MSFNRILSILHMPQRKKITIWKKVIFGSFLGITFGNFYAKYTVADPLTDNHLVAYQNENQFTKILEQTHKPIVIYYYISSLPFHHIIREWMFRYSQKYSQNATWMMISIPKHFLKLKNINFEKFHGYPLIQIKIPYLILKQNEQGKKFIQKKYSQRVFQGRIDQKNFLFFLETAGVKPLIDPLSDFYMASQRTIFA